MKIAEIKVSYTTNQPDKVRLTNFKDTYQFILSHWDMNIIEYQEESKIILLNRGNGILGIYQLSKGGISGTIVDLRIVLAVALKCNASGIILVHNHPSGNIQPSQADKKITKRLKQACELLELNLIDHLIISKQDCLSFAQEGLL
ncbi:JAB domain-containing protein [Flavobacterium sp.]|uniref:JAB domain-containing protein n=1 Tax=Flavobacterium sp. TaxID=239 RepID=UPI0026062C32|nr:JAB domain-containing protein [Flavobacterium sp.]